MLGLNNRSQNREIRSLCLFSNLLDEGVHGGSGAVSVHVQTSRTDGDENGEKKILQHILVKFRNYL